MPPILEPFAGVTYAATDALKDLVCPPYDIISPIEQAQLYDRHEHNAVRLELPIGDDREAKFRDAARDFAEWLSSGVLRRDSAPRLYVYRQDFVFKGERRTVTGVIGALRLGDFGAESGVLPHERTMEGPKADRLALMEACPVNISPIYGIFRGAGGLAPFYESLENRPTTARFSDDSQILHRLWTIEAKAEIQTISDAIAASTLVIADGHHRYETALAFHRNHDGEPGEHGSIMCFCVDADSADLVVLPYNRAFVSSRTRAEIATELRERFAARPIDADPEKELASSKADHPFAFLVPPETLLVEVADRRVVEAVGERASAWRALDVVALHEAVLVEIAPDASFTFSRDPGEIAGLVARGDATAGVLLRALHATEVVEVARSGERMPQKASYFWPKALTGLVFRELK